MSRLCLTLLLSGLFVSPAVLPEEGRVRGRVVLYNGAPVEGADVTFFLLDSSQELPAKETLVAKVKTNHHGEYQARDLPPGNYRVVVQLFGFGNNVVWAYVWRAADRWLDVGLAPGMTHDLETATVSGTVTSPSGQPIADVTVTLASAYDVSDYSQTRTNSNGRFTLSTLQPGDYVAWATKDGFAASARAIEIRNGGKQSTAFQLRKRGQ